MNGSFRILAIRVAAPAAASALALLALPSCVRVKVDPIETKPIRVEHNVNIRIDRELDEFFDFQEKLAATQPATAPTTTAAQADQAQQGVTP